MQMLQPEDDEGRPLSVGLDLPLSAWHTLEGWDQPLCVGNPVSDIQKQIEELKRKGEQEMAELEAHTESGNYRPDWDTYAKKQLYHCTICREIKEFTLVGRTTQKVRAESVLLYRDEHGHEERI